MNTRISAEKKRAIRTRINDLYVMCGSISPIAFFIKALTNQFDSLVDKDCKAFEARLTDVEKKMAIYNNKDGVSRSVAESECCNHLLVYHVKNDEETEGRYFYNIELANLFILAAVKKTLNLKYHIAKIFNGYSVPVTSKIFFT